MLIFFFGRAKDFVGRAPGRTKSARSALDRARPFEFDLANGRRELRRTISKPDIFEPEGALDDFCRATGLRFQRRFSTSCRSGLGPIGGDKTTRLRVENGAWQDLAPEAFCKRGASLWKLSGFAPENSAGTGGFGAWRWATGHRRPNQNIVRDGKQNKGRAQQARPDAGRQKRRRRHDLANEGGGGRRNNSKFDLGTSNVWSEDVCKVPRVEAQR